jgi:hypothetical protein
MRRLTPLSVAVGALLLSASCTKAPPPGPRIDPAISSFIPVDTTLLVGVRLEKIEKSPVYERYLAHQAVPLVDPFMARTGITPANLWEILYVSNGSRGAVIGHGMFSDEGEPDLERAGATRFKYKRFNFVGNSSQAILLVDQTVFAAGDTEQLEAMVDAQEKSAGPPEGMKALLARMPSNAQMWAAYSGGALKLPFAANSNLGNINKIVSMIQTGTINLNLDMGLTGLAEGTSGSDQDAEQLESGLRALIGFGRLSVPANQPDLQRIFDGLRPTREGREVKLHIDEPEDLIGQLSKMLSGRGGTGN